MSSKSNPKRNRIAIYVEDDVWTACGAYAERLNIPLSELGRRLVLTQLHALGLIPEDSIKKFAGMAV